MTIFEFIGFFAAESAMKLALVERTSINTLAYMALITMAYYGPNAELMGNIKLSIWQYKRPIMDLGAYLFDCSLLMLVDIATLVINGTLLWYHCNINILDMIKKLQEKYWFPFAIVEAFSLMVVSILSCA